MSSHPTGARPLPDLYETISERDGGQIVRLFGDQQAWVHRRVETIEFHDDTSVRREVSVDLTVPSEAPVVDGIVPSPTCLLPLAQLRKGDLKNFDLRDETGAPLPLLTAAQNKVVVGRGLAFFAELITGSPLEASLAADLQEVVGGDRRQVARARQRFLSPSPTDISLPQLETLLADEAFRDMVRDLSETFLLITLVPHEPGKRRILKFGYDEVLDVERDAGDAAQDLSRRRRLARRFGMVPTTVGLPNPLVWAAQSFHVEVALPPEVVATKAFLLVGNHEAPARVRRPASYGRRIHMSVADVPFGHVGTTVVYLVASRRGWLTTCLYSTGIVAVVQTLGAGKIRDLMSAPGPATTVFSFLPQSAPSTGSRGDSVALILALVAVLSSLTTRAATHALAGYLLARLRLAVGISGLMTYILGATAVFGWPEGEVVVWLWRSAALVSLGIFSLVVWSYTRPRQRPR